MQTERLVLIIVGSIFFLLWLVSDKSPQTLTEKQKRLPAKYRLIHERPAEVMLIIALTLLSVAACPDIWK
jgi:hypothetical protein